MPYTAAVSPNLCAHPAMFVRPNGSQRPLPVGCGGLTVPVDHHKLIACSSGLCVTAGHGGSVRAWPAPRPRFNCGLGSSGSSHVILRGPHRSGHCPQYLGTAQQPGDLGIELLAMARNQLSILYRARPIKRPRLLGA